LTKAFLRSFETRDGTMLGYYAPDAVQREFPNALTKAGATRTAADLLRGMEAGLKSVREERYELVNLVAHGDEVAVEVIWTAVLNVGFGSLAPGATMKAYLGIFLTWRDGKIVSQRNYDCIEPF